MKKLNIQQIEAHSQFKEVAAPSTPPTGYVAVYAKADGKLYIKDDAGLETDLTATGPGGGGITEAQAKAISRRYAVAL